MRDSLTGEELDEGRFTGTVGTDDTDSGRKGEGARSILDRRSGGTRIGECTVGKFEDRSCIGSDTDEVTRRREGELDRSSGKSVVGLGRRDLFDKLGEVTGVIHELLAFIVDNVGTNVVEETRVVRDDHTGDVVQAADVFLKPSDSLDVQVVSRFVAEFQSQYNRILDR